MVTLHIFRFTVTDDSGRGCRGFRISYCLEQDLGRYSWAGRSYFSFDYSREEETEMVSGDPEGSQGECRRAPELVQREQSTRESWVLLGDGDQYLRSKP
jgi:hypothetical protein